VFTIDHHWKELRLKMIENRIVKNLWGESNRKIEKNT
jgi:hypothetical protein